MAIEESHAALALDANDQQAVYHLIVALRKSGQREQIPSLLKRLIALRSNDKSGYAPSNRYRLYESPISTGPAAP